MSVAKVTMVLSPDMDASGLDEALIKNIAIKLASGVRKIVKELDFSFHLVFDEASYRFKGPEIPDQLKAFLRECLELPNPYIVNDKEVSLTKIAKKFHGILIEGTDKLVRWSQQWAHEILHRGNPERVKALLFRANKKLFENWLEKIQNQIRNGVKPDEIEIVFMVGSTRQSLALDEYTSRINYCWPNVSCFRALEHIKTAFEKFLLEKGLGDCTVKLDKFLLEDLTPRELDSPQASAAHVSSSAVVSDSLPSLYGASFNESTLVYEKYARDKFKIRLGSRFQDSEKFIIILAQLYHLRSREKVVYIFSDDNRNKILKPVWNFLLSEEGAAFIPKHMEIYLVNYPQINENEETLEGGLASNYAGPIVNRAENDYSFESPEAFFAKLDEFTGLPSIVSYMAEHEFERDVDELRIPYEESTSFFQKFSSYIKNPLPQRSLSQSPCDLSDDLSDSECSVRFNARAV